MTEEKLCSHGHVLEKGNLTDEGKCAICYRNRYIYSKTPNKDKTHCQYGHLLSGSNVKITIDKNGRRRRDCNQCHAERSRAYYYNKVKSEKHPRNKPGRPRKY